MVGPACTRVPSAVAALASVLALAWPGDAAAAESDDRPWGRRVMRPSFGLSPWGLLNQDVASLSFGLGFNYFVINGLSLGVGLSDTIFIYRSAFKAQYPGIETQLPTNMLEITPSLQYVFFRSRWFSPYVYGGVGPVFFNHGAGTHGQWVAGPGVYINVAGPLYVSLGVGFSGLFPTGRCNDALTYQPEDAAAQGVMLDLCSFRWGIQPGLVLAFGGGGRGRERRPPPREHERVPASNPLDEAVAPEPEAEATSDGSEPPVEPPPDGAAGIEAEPPADTEPVDSPEGDDTAPVDSPEGESTAPVGSPEGEGPAPVDSPEGESIAPGSTDVPLPPQSGRIAPPG